MFRHALAMGIWLFLVGSLTSQVLVQNAYDLQPWHGWPYYDGARNDQGGFTLMARRVTNVPPYRLDLGLIRTDVLGQVTDTIAIELGGMAGPMAYLRAADGGGWYVGSFKFFGENLQRALIVRTNSADRPLWAKAYTPVDTSSFMFYDVAEFGNGDIGVVGMPDSGPGTMIRLLATRIDTSGTVVWATQFSSDSLVLRSYSLGISATDQVLLSGSAGQSGIGDGSLALALDPSGSLQWAREVGDSLVSHPRAAITASGDWIVFGSQLVDGEYVGCLYRVDAASGNLEQAIRMGQQITSAVALPDSSFVMALAQDTGTYLVRAMADGTMLWSKGVEVLGIGRIRNLQGFQRFAYFSGDGVERLDVHTFHVGGGVCGYPGDSTLVPVSIPLLQAPVPLTVGNLPLTVIPLQLVEASFPLVATNNCTTGVGFAEYPVLQELPRCRSGPEGSFTWHLPDHEQVLDVVLRDGLGRLVSQLPASVESGRWTTQMASHLPKGIYFMEVRSTGPSWTCPVAVW